MFDGIKALSRVRALEDSFDTLQREHKAIRLEWETAYDKLTAIVQRITKRARVIEQASEATEGPEVTTGPRAVLTRQDQLQAEILARRARANGGKESA